MSGKEYTFHNRQSKPNPSITITVPKKKSDSSGNVKQTILNQYDHYIEMTTRDPIIKRLFDTQQKLSAEITNTFGILQKSENKDESRSLNEKMNRLTELYNKTKKEYDDLMKKELSVVYQTWPGIYEKIIEGVDRETLVHVLTVFEDYQKGNIDADGAVMNGMDYMTSKYSLPKDFFNKSAVSEFNKHINELS